ncbi:hypothetical protein MPSEU_000741700 [Mayamaea pseudoterrestris]|nr:hypothetical protein MPSEU_000741700 [Mayamaea pseudoterrestris]
MPIRRKLLIFLVLCHTTRNVVASGLLYQISLNGKGDISQKEINRIGQQAYQKTINIIEKCFGANYDYVAPGEQVDVDSSARKLIENDETALLAQHDERALTTIKLCPRNKCRLKRNYEWCYLLGCICKACGGRRRYLKSSLGKCDSRLNKVIGFLQRKYDVDLEIVFTEVP